MRAASLLGHRRALSSSFSSCLRLWTNKTTSGSGPGPLRTTRMMWGRLSTQRRLLFLEVSVLFLKVFEIWPNGKVKVPLIVTSQCTVTSENTCKETKQCLLPTLTYVVSVQCLFAHWLSLAAFPFAVFRKVKAIVQSTVAISRCFQWMVWRAQAVILVKSRPVSSSVQT